MKVTKNPKKWKITQVFWQIGHFFALFFFCKMFEMWTLFQVFQRNNTKSSAMQNFVGAAFNLSNN